MVPRTWVACLAATAAAGVQDGASLVQSAVHVHGSHQGQLTFRGLERALDSAMAMVGSQMSAAVNNVQAEQRLPPLKTQQDSSTLTLQRSTGQAIESGSYMDLQITQGCDDCPLRWGDALNLNSKVHLASGLKKGDRVSMTVEAVFDVMNTKSPFSALFMGDKLMIDGSCEVCSGACKFWAKQEGDSWDVTFPSFVNNELACENGAPVEGLREIQLMDNTFNTPRLNASFLGLMGHINLSLALTNDAGFPKASSSAALVFTAPSEKRILLARDQQQSAQTPQTRLLPGFLETAVTSFAANLAEQSLNAGADTAPQALNLMESSQETSREAATLLVSNIDILKLEGGSVHNFTIDGEDCEHRGRYGSVGCKFHFGQSSTLSSSAHIATTLDPGAHMIVSVKPRVSGPLAHAMSRMLDQFYFEELELPLCGDPFEFPFKGGKGSFNPPGCGYYEINMNMKDHTIDLPAADRIKLPRGQGWSQYLAAPIMHLNKFPSMTLELRAKLFHNNGAPIVDLKADFKLDHGI